MMLHTNRTAAAACAPAPIFTSYSPKDMFVAVSPEGRAKLRSMLEDLLAKTGLSEGEKADYRARFAQFLGRD